MAAACLRSGRSPDAARLVAISKTVPVERLRLAQAAGHDLLGENRVQEAAAKIPALGPATWHLVGHLQKNKAAKAIELFDAIESVDSVALATRLDRLVGEHGSRSGGPLPIYLQVNVDGDPAKAGFTPDALERELDEVLALPNIERARAHDGRLADDRVDRGAGHLRPAARAIRAPQGRRAAPGAGPVHGHDR